MAKVIEAKFNGGIFACTEPSWKWDYGDRLVFSDIELPASYEVHFANKTVGTSVTVLGDENGVVIPAQFFVPGSVIYAWIFLVDGENGYTKYQVVMPILDRAQPSNEQPTPTQQSALDDAVARLNAAAAEMEENAMTPEERTKLSGIEAGAEVNVIEEIKAWDRIRQRYVALPIVDKSVSIPRRADAIVPISFTLTGDLDDLSVASSISPSDVLNKEYEDDRIEAKLVTGSLFAGKVLLLESCDSNSVDFSGVINVDDSSITYLYILGDPITDEWYAFASYIPTVEGVDNALANIVSVPDGGTTNQVLAKASDDDGDLKWVNQSGGGGGTSDYTDLSNKPQINGHTLSGNQSASDLGLAPAGAYVKPSGGIPKTDLASGVQTSLEKADSALQSAPVTSVNSKTGAVVLSASDVGAGTYSKPSGGIPKTDLSSAVQTSLGKADTALQTAPVTSVNGQTGAVTISVPSSAADVGAVAVAQGVAHAGEFVVVGSDGNITTVTMSVWQGGSF